MNNQGIVVSVVLPCYNGGALLRVQLEALAAQEYEEPWELLFMDNGSTDGSAEMAREFENRIPNLRVIDASAEQGQPYALNLGIKLARGPFILTVDADDEVAPGWLRAMAEALREHRFVASRKDLVKFNPPWLQWSQQSEVLPKLWYHPYMPYAAGATLGFRKSLFEEIGPFDPALPYLHDTEFCIQAQLRGVTIFLVKDALLHYRRRNSLKAHYRQSRNYAVYNTILAKRHMPQGGKKWPRVKEYVKEWIRFFKMLPRIRSITRRYDMAWIIGRQLGRVEGVVKFGGTLV
jgi:glycosyltransferase involved in cell wall biosynthesis